MPSNKKRAKSASKALDAYAASKESQPANYRLYEDLTTQTADLLTDLLHLARKQGQPLDLVKALRLAEGNFEVEGKQPA